MSIRVIKPGLLSSFQDLGRVGHQHLGVPVGGAMDARAHRLANLLAGNAEDTATLEITLTGPTLRFGAAACIAIAGAELSPTLNGDPIANNRPHIVRSDDILAFGPRQSGVRAHLAVHGGFAVDHVMGSSSTYLRGGFGGFQGRALKKDDQVAMRAPLAQSSLDELSDKLWDIKVYLPAILRAAPRTTLRVMVGDHASLFTEQALRDFFDSDYRIGAASERMGYRLEGSRLPLITPAQLLSEATSFGSIQVPPDGLPIILMADRQTTGGYPKIAHVASVDLSQVAQRMPGDTLRFSDITVDEARQLDSQREEAFAQLAQQLAPLRELLAR